MKIRTCFPNVDFLKNGTAEGHYTVRSQHFLCRQPGTGSAPICVCSAELCDHDPAHPLQYIVDDIDDLLAEQNGQVRKVKSDEFDIAAFSWYVSLALLCPRNRMSPKQTEGFLQESSHFSTRQSKQQECQSAKHVNLPPAG